MERKRRIAISLPKDLIEDLDDVAVHIGRERGKVCTKSELLTIAAATFIAGYQIEKERKD